MEEVSKANRTKCKKGITFQRNFMVRHTTVELDTKLIDLTESSLWNKKKNGW